MTWFTFLAAIAKLLSSVGPMIALYFAHRAGKKSGEAAANVKQTAINAKAQKRYEEIELREMGDEEVSDILDRGDL